MADSSIWSRLPEHLVCCIIELAKDTETRRNWCDATKGNSLLHRIALRGFWCSFTVHRENLLEKSDDTEDPFGCEKARKELERAIRFSPWTGANPFPIKPASLIQRLVLNFQHGFYDGTFTRDVLSNGNHTLKSLIHHCSCLERVDHYGVLSQKMLFLLVRMRNVTTLRLRKTSRSIPPLGHEGTAHLSSPLKFGKLHYMRRLVILDISALLLSEARGLAHAIMCLDRLQELRVATHPKWPLPGEDPLIHYTPMAILLRRLCCRSHISAIGSDLLSPEAAVGLPASLKKLTLIDNQRHFSSDYISLKRYTSTPLVHLQDLYIDIPFESVIHDLLRIFNPPSLARLFLPTILADGVYIDQPTCQNYILRHFSSVSKKSVLLDVWDNCELIPGWREVRWNTYGFRLQLYLSGPPAIGRDDIRIMWIDQLSVRIFGFPAKDVRWRSDIRHIRIDQVDASTLVVDPIDSRSQGLQELKVLVLRPPERRKPGPWYWTLETQETESCYDVPSGPSLPEMIDVVPECKAAAMIAKQNLPSLRVIAVGKYQFWVQHCLVSVQNESKIDHRLWIFSRALEDSEQKAQIMSVMNEDDWDFLADTSPPSETDVGNGTRRSGDRVVFYKPVDDSGWIYGPIRR